MAYHRAVKDGNADVINSCWTSAGAIFHTTHRTNYFREYCARTTLLKYSLPAKDAYEAQWNATVNLSGRKDGAVEVDKSLEFDNCDIKEASRHLGPNLCEDTMKVMSESRVQVDKIYQGLLSDFQARPRGGRHNHSVQADQILLVQLELRKAGVFSLSPPQAAPPAPLSPSPDLLNRNPFSLLGLFDEQQQTLPGKVTARMSHGRFALAPTGLFGLNSRGAYDATLLHYSRSPLAIRNYQGVCAALQARNPNAVLPPPPKPLPFNVPVTVVVEDGSASEHADSEDDEGAEWGEEPEPESPPLKRQKMSTSPAARPAPPALPASAALPPTPAVPPTPAALSAPPASSPDADDPDPDPDLSLLGERQIRVQPARPPLMNPADVPLELRGWKAWDKKNSCHFDAFDSVMRHALKVPAAFIPDAQDAFNKSVGPSGSLLMYLKNRAGINQQGYRVWFSTAFNDGTAGRQMSRVEHWLKSFSKDPPGTSLLGMAITSACCDTEAVRRYCIARPPPSQTIAAGLNEFFLRESSVPCAKCTRIADVSHFGIGQVLAVEVLPTAEVPLADNLTDFSFSSKLFRLCGTTRFVNRNHFVAYLKLDGQWFLVDGVDGVGDPQMLTNDDEMIGERNFFFFSVSDSVP